MKRNIILIIIFLLAVSVPASELQAKLMLELKAGPEITRAQALDFFGLEKDAYGEQDLLSSLSLGFLMVGILGISVEGMIRSPQYLNNRFSGTGFERGYVNIFLELLFIRAGIGADISTITENNRNIQTFAGFMMRIKSFAMFFQLAAYGNHAFPNTFSFGNNVSIQFGCSLVFRIKKEKPSWAETDDEGWKDFWEQRLNESMETTAKEPQRISYR